VREDARADGLEKGIEKGIAITVNGLYKQGVAIEVICAATNLSKEEVQKILKDNLE
jgi:predicted transposase YdaD